MAKRQNEWAARARADLIRQLGGACALCGEDNPAKLEFDHIAGRDWDLCRVSSTHRISIYRREAARGELRLLCGVCNRLQRKTNDNGQFVPTAAAVMKTCEAPF